MAEIISIQVGECGNRIGTRFWQNILSEHWLDHVGSFQPTQNLMSTDCHHVERRLDKISCYFHEIDADLLNGFVRQNIENSYPSLIIPADIKRLLKYYYGAAQKYVPRSILVDLEPSVLDSIKASHIGDMFTDNICISGSDGCGYNWAKGHYTKGAEWIDKIMDIVRYQTEKCDQLQGFQLCHSLGGGTGSGLGTLILSKLADEYPGRVAFNFAVFPSPKVSDVVVEPYNTVLSIQRILEHSTYCFMIDNDALFNISHNVLKAKEPRYDTLNRIVSFAMSGITASFRFNGENGLHDNLRKFGMNMVTFPNLKFLLSSVAPLCDMTGHVRGISIGEVCDQLWSQRNFLANIKPEDGKYIMTAEMYRGTGFCLQEIHPEISNVACKMNDDFISWIPNNTKCDLIKETSPDGSKSGTFIANTTALKGVFQRITAQFAKMYKREAFLHWYQGEGMDTLEFDEADTCVRDLVTEYQDKQDAVVELDDPYDYEGDEIEETWSQSDGVLDIE
eukprot:110868_1